MEIKYFSLFLDDEILLFLILIDRIDVPPHTFTDNDLNSQIFKYLVDTITNIHK
jgi:hypothetical protein